MSYPVRDVRRRIQTEHGQVVSAIDDCANCVASPWDTSRTTNREAVIDPFRTALAERDLLEQLARVLADVVDAAGYDLPETPVPAPPYVVVTSRGPLLRATIGPGRLVIRFDAFEVIRDSTPNGAATYRRRDGVSVDVSLV